MKGIVIRNEAAFHFFLAIGADGGLFHLSFLVVFAVSVTWLGSDAASGCLSGVTFHAIEFGALRRSGIWNQPSFAFEIQREQ